MRERLPMEPEGRPMIGGRDEVSRLEEIGDYDAADELRADLERREREETREQLDALDRLHRRRRPRRLPASVQKPKEI